MPAQPVQHSHSRERAFAHLRGADEVEIAHRTAFLAALCNLGFAKATLAADSIGQVKTVANMVAAMALSGNFGRKALLKQRRP